MIRSPVKLFSLLLVVGMSLWIFETRGILSPFRGMMEIVTVPVMEGVYSVTRGIGSSISPVFSPWRNSRETESLRSQLTNQQVLESKLSMLEKENEALRDELKVEKKYTPHMLMAHPIARERYLVIDRGEKDGVVAGVAVVSGDVLVGKVERTTTHTASVLLPTDPGSLVPVWTTRLTKGVVKGEFGNTMTLDQVLGRDSLDEAEIVLTTGESGYPQNIVVGKVGKIVSESRDPFKHAALEPLLDIDKITTVFVLLP